MSAGLLALIDDVTALVKASASSLDDISTQVGKTATKVSGIVIDDAAVTPKYVVGLDPARELTIIYHISLRSLLNKLLILTPLIVGLGMLAPWLITPLLLCGATYLCVEGYEKVHQLLHHTAQKITPESLPTITPEELEKTRITSAVRTDFILSAEIITITYANVTEMPMLNQIIVTLIVGALITAVVYGVVALLVKLDDIGLYLARESRYTAVQRFGRGMVRAMPAVLAWIGYIGTVAMLWVGADIIVHAFPALEAALAELLTTHLPTEIPYAIPAATFATKLPLALLVGWVVASVVGWGMGLYAAPSK